MKKKKSVISVLGVILGILWAASIILIIAGIQNMNKEDRYVPTADSMLDILDQGDYARLRETVSSAKIAGVTADESEVHGEIFAIAEFTDGVAFDYVYKLNGDTVMDEYYSQKFQDAILESGRLDFAIDEITKAFFK